MRKSQYNKSWFIFLRTLTKGFIEVQNQGTAWTEENLVHILQEE